MEWNKTNKEKVRVLKKVKELYFIGNFMQIGADHTDTDVAMETSEIMS